MYNIFSRSMSCSGSIFFHTQSVFHSRYFFTINQLFTVNQFFTDNKFFTVNIFHGQSLFHGQQVCHGQGDKFSTIKNFAMTFFGPPNSSQETKPSLSLSSLAIKPSGGHYATPDQHRQFFCRSFC